MSDPIPSKTVPDPELLSAPLQLRFAQLNVNVATRTLSRPDGQHHKLRPKSFALLQYLFEQRGRVVGKRELFDHIWQSVVVTDDSVVQCIREIRKAIGTEFGLELRTITRQGYMLLVEDDESSDHDVAMPSVAISHIRVPNGTPLLENAAFVLYEELLSALTNMREIFVTAHGNSGQMGHSAESSTGGMEKLPVQYVLGGSLRQDDTELLAHIELTDVDQGRIVWSEPFRVEKRDMVAGAFELAARIANRVAGGATGVLSNLSMQRLRRLPHNHYDAYDCYIVGAHVDDYFSPEALHRAKGYFRNSLERNPLFSKAHYRYALLHLIDATVHIPPNAEALLKTFQYHALQSLKLDPEDPSAMVIAATAHSYLGNPTLADRLYRKALKRAPNNADLLAMTAYIRATRLPTRENDLENIRRARALNPGHPDWYQPAHSHVAFLTGRYRECLDAYVGITTPTPVNLLYRCLSHYELGEPEQAEKLHAQLRRQFPGFSIQRHLALLAHGDTDVVTHLRNCLKRSGLGMPESEATAVTVGP